MGMQPKPELDEVFALYGESLEAVTQTFVGSDAAKEIYRAEAKRPSE
jgi:hypothetical protein